MEGDRTEGGRDPGGLEARVLNGTATKADVEWLVESLEAVTAERDDLRERLARCQRAYSSAKLGALD